jgi:hypothetical protein
VACLVQPLNQHSFSALKSNPYRLCPHANAAAAGTQAVGPAQQLLWLQVALLWSPCVLSLCVAAQAGAAHALPLFAALSPPAPAANSSANITMQLEASAATSPLDFALASAYLSPLQFFSEISSVMIIAARSSPTPPLLLSAVLLPVHVALAWLLSAGSSSFHGQPPSVTPLPLQPRVSFIYSRSYRLRRPRPALRHRSHKVPHTQTPPPFPKKFPL